MLGRPRRVRAFLPLVLHYMYKLTINDLYKTHVKKKSKFLSSDNNSEIFTVNTDNQSIYSYLAWYFQAYWFLILLIFVLLFSDDIYVAVFLFFCFSLLWLQKCSFFKVKRFRARIILEWVNEWNLLTSVDISRIYGFLFSLNTFKNWHNMFSINKNYQKCKQLLFIGIY